MIKAISGLACLLLVWTAPSIRAQMWGPLPGPPSPATQRTTLAQLQTQIQWLDNATRTASMFSDRADSMLWDNFDGVRVCFGALTRTLTPRQLQAGANDLAELDAGLRIISEAFTNFQDEVNNGRHPKVAYQTLCQVVRDSMKLWARQLNLVAKRLQVGR